MNILNRFISMFNPGLAAQRHARSLALSEARKLIGQLGARSYDSGKTGKRLSSWAWSRTGPNMIVEADYGKTRERSRALARNNPYARRAVRTIPISVVGTGIVPTFTHERDGYADPVKKLWDSWASKTWCDFDGMQNFYGIQKIAQRAVVESGGCLIRKVVDSRSKNPIGMELQVLEIDYLDENKHGPLKNGGYIRKGIEFNSRNKVVAYWILNHHPSDMDFKMDRKSKRYPSRNIIHYFEQERPGQKLGMPSGHAAMVKLRDYDEYEEAQLIRQKIAACFAVFIEQSPSTLPAKANDSGDGGYDLERVEPGMIQYTGPGDNVTFGSPPVTEGYDSYSRRVLQGISAGYDMTYENMTGDLSNVNFSSGRMGWIDFGRFVKDWQHNMMIPLICDRVFEWFQEMVVVRFSEASSDVARAAKAAIMDISVSWTPPHRDFIDPWKEVKAMQEQVRSGFMSWQEAVRKLGYDPKEVLEQLTEDKKNFDDRELVLSIDMQHQLTPEVEQGAGQGEIVHSD